MRRRLCATARAKPVARRLVMVAVLVATATCRRSATQPDVGARPLPSVSITRGRVDLVFSWVDADGKYHDVTRVEDIPAARRKQVLVRDLSKRPDEVRADEFLVIADLTAESDAGFPFAVVSRYAFDRTLKDRALTGDLELSEDADGGERPGVILYATSWCGACAAARDWLTARGVRYLEKDVEKDARAQAELMLKARRAGLAVNGVPVLEVRGQLMLGFDAARLEQLLKGT